MRVMEKLKLEHLAPYLPYGLKIDVSYYREEEEDLIEIVSYVDNKLNAFVEYDTNVGAYAMPIIGEFDLYKAKPILRPLSDLNQDGEINTPETLQGCCYSYVQNLISQHYDVFGLIEKNLAIDINTLNK